MIWKFTTGVIVVFWLVMNFLFIKWEVFPSSGKFSSLPASVVLDRFFEQADPANELTLYLRGKKIGATTLAPRVLENEGHRSRGLKFIGNLRFPLDAQTKHMLLSLGDVFQVEGDILRVVLDLTYTITGENLDSAELKLRLPDVRMEVLAQQKKDQSTQFQIKKGGEVWISSEAMELLSVLQDQNASVDPDSTKATALLKEGGVNPAELQVPLQYLREGAEKPLNLSAETGEMSISGQRQDVFRLNLEALMGLKLVMELSQAGEIMRVSGIPEIELRSPLWLMEE